MQKIVRRSAFRFTVFLLDIRINLRGKSEFVCGISAPLGGRFVGDGFPVPRYSALFPIDSNAEMDLTSGTGNPSPTRGTLSNSDLPTSAHFLCFA